MNEQIQSQAQEKFTPFSDDIVFFDAEFTGMNACIDDLMAVGMVNFDGTKELYFELPYDDAKVAPWTREHVLPFLTGENILPQEQAREAINDFCGSSEPHLVATVNQRDMGFFHKLYEGHKEPIHTIPIDFASILFGMGLDPSRRINGEKEPFYKQFDIDLSKYNLHNALDDAKLMRELYFLLAKKSIH